MDDASITPEKTTTEQNKEGSLYQQGRFPSIVDTDDLVFELGKQTVDIINKEKIIDAILKKSKMLEAALHEATEARSIAEARVEELEKQLGSETFTGKEEHKHPLRPPK